MKLYTLHESFFYERFPMSLELTIKDRVGILTAETGVSPTYLRLCFECNQKLLQELKLESPHIKHWPSHVLLYGGFVVCEETRNDQKWCILCSWDTYRS